MANGTDRPSAFLWADEIVGREGGAGGADDGEGEGNRAGEGGAGGEDGEAGEGREAGEGSLQAGSIRERKWTADRMRRVMQQHSSRFLGKRVWLSA